MSIFKKIAEEREKRQEKLYAMEVETPEDDALFSRICSKCRVPKRLLDENEKKKHAGLSKTEIAWECPICEEVTQPTSSIDQQTDGMSLMNNIPTARHSIIDDGFKDLDSIKEGEAQG